MQKFSLCRIVNKNLFTNLFDRDSAIFVKHASAKGVHAAVLRTDGVREGAFEHVAKVVFVGETEKNILIFKSMLLQV